MRIERHGANVRLILSARNLRVLLSKLDMADSACTIVGQDDHGGVFVSSEPDDQHYRDREPGPMHPLTEASLRRG